MIAGFGIGILVAVLVLVSIIAINEVGFDKPFTEWDIKTDKTYLTRFSKVSIAAAIATFV